MKNDVGELDPDVREILLAGRAQPLPSWQAKERVLGRVHATLGIAVAAGAAGVAGASAAAAPAVGHAAVATGGGAAPPAAAAVLQAAPTVVAGGISTTIVGAVMFAFGAGTGAGAHALKQRSTDRVDRPSPVVAPSAPVSAAPAPKAEPPADAAQRTAEMTAAPPRPPAVPRARSTAPPHAGAGPGAPRARREAALNPAAAAETPTVNVAHEESAAEADGRPPAAPASSPEGDLAAERRLLETARAALAAGDHQAALAALDGHARQFSRPRLAEEREVLAIRALAASGRGDDARSRAAAFRQTFPRSLFLRVVDGTLRSLP